MSTKNQIIECVPNFSEGKNLQAIEQIIAAVKSVPETKFLDLHTDPSHNRSVISFAGPPDFVLESAFRAVQKAAELIDIRNHIGVHPRFGATDVLPLVPIQNISKEECRPLAQKLASRIQNELHISTEFYEESGPRSLPEMRKKLAASTAHLSPLNPTPHHTGLHISHHTDLHTSHHTDLPAGQFYPGAGTTLIGVRGILIAYNIHIADGDPSIAKKIATKIRGPFVRALGFEIAHRNCIQVSTNLIDFHHVKPLDVFQQVQAEAARLNLQILDSEIVGLIPRAALPIDPQNSLLLKNFPENQILENALGIENLE